MDLIRLRLTAARAYVKALECSLTPMTASLTEPLKMNAVVRAPPGPMGAVGLSGPFQLTHCTSAPAGPGAWSDVQADAVHPEHSRLQARHGPRCLLLVRPDSLQHEDHIF